MHIRDWEVLKRIVNSIEKDVINYDIILNDNIPFKFMKGSVFMFTIEEITLLDSYRKTDLRKTIEEIKSNYQYQEDQEIINLIDALFIKLEKISENDYTNIDFSLSLADEPNFK